LTDEIEQARNFGSPAKISKKVGGRFTAWGSHITGFNLALLPRRKIYRRGEQLAAGLIITR
jgi:hypothetical protein